MNSYLSALVLKNGDIVCNPEFQDIEISDDFARTNEFVRVAFSPPTYYSNILDIQRWTLRIESSTPDWWYLVFNKVQDSLRAQVQQMFVQDKRSLLEGGCWILGEGADVEVVKDARVWGMFGNARIERVCDTSRIEQMWGKTQVGIMRDFSRVGTMYGNAQVGEMFGDTRIERMRNTSQMKVMREKARVGRMYSLSQVGVMYETSQIEIMYNTSQVGEMRDMSRIKQMLDSSRVGVMYETSQVGKMHDSSKIIKDCR